MSKRARNQNLILFSVLFFNLMIFSLWANIIIITTINKQILRLKLLKINEKKNKIIKEKKEDKEEYIKINNNNNKFKLKIINK